MENNNYQVAEDVAEQFLRERDNLIAKENPVQETQQTKQSPTIGEKVFAPTGPNINNEPIGTLGQAGVAGSNYTPEGIPSQNPRTPITSLGKAKYLSENDSRKEYMDDLKDNFSWKNLPIENLPSQGMFYPENSQISIRSALVQEIRNFSTIDETDLIDVDDKLNMIIDKCCRIMFDGTRVTFKELLELDRFYLVYSVREMTFKDGENKLQMNINCPECGNSDMVDLQKDNFSFFDFPEQLMRFYNKDERAFVLTLRETGEKISVYLPTLGVTNYIKQYVRKRAQNNKHIDKAFLKISPFLFSDWRRVSDNTYDGMNENSFGWSIEKMSGIIGVVDMLQRAINPEITHNCHSCSAEIKAPLSFQGGVKGLFLYSFDNSGDFFSRFV